MACRRLWGQSCSRIKLTSLKGIKRVSKPVFQLPFSCFRLSLGRCEWCSPETCFSIALFVFQVNIIHICQVINSISYDTATTIYVYFLYCVNKQGILMIFRTYMCVACIYWGSVEALSDWRVRRFCASFFT